MIDQLLNFFGLMRIPTLIHSPGAIAISESAKRDFDFLKNKTGLTAIKVDNELRFNSTLDYQCDPDRERIEYIIKMYSKCGYIFVSKEGFLIGHLCYVDHNN